MRITRLKKYGFSSALLAVLMGSLSFIPSCGHLLFPAGTNPLHLPDSLFGGTTNWFSGIAWSGTQFLAVGETVR